MKGPGWREDARTRRSAPSRATRPRRRRSIASAAPGASCSGRSSSRSCGWRRCRCLARPIAWPPSSRWWSCSGSPRRCRWRSPRCSGRSSRSCCQVAPARAALAPFADPIIFLFIGSFILAEAMFVHGLDRRIAFTALASRWVGTSGTRILVVYGLVGTVISMWMSNTATTAMMFPIGVSIVAQLRRGIDGAGRGAAQVRDGDDAHHVVRRLDWRDGDAGRDAAEPDRHRTHRAHHRHAHRLLPLDGHRRAAGPDPLHACSPRSSC